MVRPSLGPDRLLGGAAVLAVVSLALCIAVGVALAYDATRADTPVRVESPVAPPAVTGAAPAAPAGGSASGGQGAPAPDPYRPSDPWVAQVSAATGIPVRALAAYARAHLRVSAEQPGCRVGWNTLAALGGVESGHGSAGGAVLGEDGYPRPAIRGPALDGRRFASIPDTDGGVLDGDTEWDRAVGPLQFIPSTWERWAADGDGDGVADPDQIDDAALAAGRYLCHSGDLADPGTWRRAVFSFNHSDVYVADIAALANRYAAQAA